MHTIARTVARAPLRARLTAASVLLVALGLVAAGAATHFALQSFLIDRVDQEFGPAEGPALDWVSDGDGGSRHCVDNALPLNAYVVAVLPGGALQYPHFHGRGRATDELGELAQRAPLGYSSAGGYRLRSLDTAQVAAGLGPAPVCGPGGDQHAAPAGRLVIAISTADVSSTLSRLDRVELMIGLVVVAIAGGLAWALVRVELRPLQRIEDTAAAIAAGDLSRRVDAGDPGTEVGSLGESLNAMLAQIELAFDERRASENRLRRFVADAGHELRTPLTSVRGYAELYRRGGAAHRADLAMIMSRIESEAQRMGVLVEDLLLLAKLDQGRPLARQQVKVSEVVAEMAGDQAMLNPAWPVERHIAPGVEVVGDELRIRQAVGNLLANARAHTPPGTRIVVTVQMRAGMAMVAVADEGPGVPPDVMGRLFERFFRADPSRSRASGGSGLGLSIVAAIAEAHGGRVEVESPEGGGAVFRILLPPVPTPEAGAMEDATAPEPESA
jgi:two-component system, OmpR family, sensor kinase